MTSDDYKANPEGVNPSWIPNLIKYFSGVAHTAWTFSQMWTGNGYGSVNINTYDYVDQNFQAANQEFNFFATLGGVDVVP